MHPECASYAKAACPMLAGKMATYRHRDRANGRPCTEPGCGCGGWTTVPTAAPAKAGQPAEQWYAVWLDDFGITIDTDRRITGVTWAHLTPRRIKPLHPATETP